MPDNQGRGDYLDDSRIEKHNQRPIENATATASKISAQQLASALGENNMSTSQLRDQVASQVSQTIATGGNNYSLQLRLLENFKTKIQALPSDLGSMTQDYQQNINSLEAHGFKQDYTQPLRQKHRRFAEKIAEMNQLIHNHISQIEAEQTNIRQLQNIAK